MNKEAAGLQREIQHTRERMTETLDELGYRLNPRHIKAQVKHNIREATVGRVENMARNAAGRISDTGHGLMDTIRDNPIPAALVGVGLGWMLFNGRRHESRQLSQQRLVDDRLGSDEYGYYGDISARTPRLRQDDVARGDVSARGDFSFETGRESEGVIGSAREKVSDIADTAQERIADVAERAGERAGAVSHRARDVAEDVAESTRWQARRLEHRVEDALQETPLAVGAIAVALGMAAGFAIPETRKERQLLGSARDQFVDRVREKVDETRDKVEHVAERVVDEAGTTAKDTAREEGLMS